MLSSDGHLFLCLNGILSWNVSNLSFLMSSVFLSLIKNVKQLNGNTLIEPIINSFFLCDMVKLKLFLEIWNWLRWTFSVGDLPRLASQVSCVLAVHRDRPNLVQALHQKSVGILRQFRGFIHLFTVEWSSFDLILIPVMKKQQNSEMKERKKDPLFRTYFWTNIQ